MLENLDTMYYRNNAIIANQVKCSRYKSLRSYSSCTEDNVEKTATVDRGVDFNYKRPTPPTPDKKA